MNTRFEARVNVVYQSAVDRSVVDISPHGSRQLLGERKKHDAISYAHTLTHAHTRASCGLAHKVKATVNDDEDSMSD